MVAARAHRALRNGLALAALALAACAGTGDRPVLHYGVEDAPEGKPLMWPAAPETPRYLYAGQLLGEQNFRARGEAASGFRRLLQIIAGIVAGERAPVVLQRPQSGVVDEQGRVYVTDASRQAVFVFDALAGELAVWDKAEGLTGFVAPVGIALGPAHEILVADAELGIVARLDARGETLPPIGRGVLKRPTGLAYDAIGGRIYVADTYAHDVKVFDSGGKLLSTLGRRGSGEGEFNFPTHLAFARGELYVADTLNSRIEVFSMDGTGLVRTFGARGLWVGNLVRPKGVAVDTEGNVYVVESYHDHLLVFDRDGAFLMAIGGLGQDAGRFYLPAGVWTDAKNRVFVADMFNGRVAVFQFLGGGAEGEY
jgi:DNA-binding beta-propeller fold protein YncE